MSVLAFIGVKTLIETLYLVVSIILKTVNGQVNGLDEKITDTVAVIGVLKNKEVFLKRH